MFLVTLAWGLLIGGIIFVIFKQSAKNNSASDSGDEDRALRILKSRYAKGEINKQEFEDMKRDIPE